MRGHLVDQTAALDDLLERSRKSWNRTSPPILASSDSVEFSILSDSNRFSTIAWNFDYEKNEPPATSFPFDHELKDSKVYRRVILNRMRRESVQGSSMQFLDETNAASPDLLEGYPMGQVSMVDTINRAAPSVASDGSDGIKQPASPLKPHVSFTDNKRSKESSSSVTGRAQHLQKVVTNLPRRAPWLCKVLLLGSGAVGKSPLVLQVCH